MFISHPPILKEIAGWGPEHDAKKKALKQIALLKFGEVRVPRGKNHKNETVYEIEPNDPIVRNMLYTLIGAIPLGNSPAKSGLQYIRVFLKCIVWKQVESYILNGKYNEDLYNKAQSFQRDWYSEGPIEKAQSNRLLTYSNDTI